MDVIRWKDEGNGIVGAYVGCIQMARVEDFGRSDGKLTWRTTGFVPDGSHIDVEYHCWDFAEAKADVEDTIEGWLEDAELVPRGRPLTVFDLFGHKMSEHSLDEKAGVA